MDAIIFLAPISVFDQVLSENRTVNRLVSLFPSFFSLLLFFAFARLVFGVSFCIVRLVALF